MKLASASGLTVATNDAGQPFTLTKGGRSLALSEDEVRWLALMALPAVLATPEEAARRKAEQP